MYINCVLFTRPIMVFVTFDGVEVLPVHDDSKQNENTADYYKTSQSSESSKSILSLNYSLIHHLRCQQQPFHTFFCRKLQKCLN